MSDEEQQIEAITSFIHEKGILTVTNSDNTFFFKIREKSFLHILSMIKEDILTNWINITTISDAKKGIKGYEMDESYKNLLLKTEDYYVIPSTILELSDEEKAEGSIPIKTKNFQKIIKMAGYDWEQFLNFIHIIITQVTYSKLQRLIRRRSKISVQYMNLFEYILIYCIKYKGNIEIDITSYSINRILNMIGLDIYDLVEYMNLNLLTITYEEVTMRKARLKYLKRKSSVLTRKKNIEINETENTFKIKKSVDKAYRLKRHTLCNFENDIWKASDLITKNKTIINQKKEEIMTILKNDDTYLNIKDESNINILIRMKLHKEIISSDDSTVDVYEIPDYYGKSVKVKKSQLSGMKEDKFEEYVLIQVITIENKTIQILVLKKTIIEIIEKWNSINKIEEVLDKITGSKIKIMVSQVSLVPLEDVSLSVQPEELKIINEKKTKIRSGLLQQSKSLFIEYEDKKLILSRLYEKITEHPGTFDEFTVKNHYDGKNIIVSKRKLKSKPKNNYAEYVEVTYSEKCCIVKKAQFENVLNQWNRMANKIKLKNYITEQNEEIDIIKTNDVISSDHQIEEETKELPYQPGEAKETKERISKDISEDNEFTMIPTNKILIRTTIIKEIESRTKDNEDTIYNVIDNNNNKQKLKRRAVLAEGLESYVEIVETETKKKSCVKTKDLNTILDDSSKDEAEITNENGAIIHIKKSHIQVAKQSKAMLGLQIDQIKFRIKNLLRHYFIIVQNEGGDYTLIRKEYITLINNHKPNVPFDRYEITNANNTTVYVSKKSLGAINLDSTDHFILIKNKKDSSIAHISQATLMKYLKEDYELNENEQLELESYDITQDKKAFVLQKIKILIQHIELVELNPVSLPYQPEEELMKALIEKRRIATEPNNQTDFAQIMNTENRPIILRKKIIQEIIRVNKVSSISRQVFKVIDALTFKEERINISSINNNPSNTSDLFVMITLENKIEVLVNKDQLRDCLTKADNSRCKLDCVEYVSNQIITITTVTTFEYTKVNPNVTLPLQEEIKLQQTVVASNDLNKVTTTVKEAKSIRPQAFDDPNNSDEFHVEEEESALMHSETKMIEKPKMKSDTSASSSKRVFIVRRAIIRRVVYDNE